MMPAAWPEVVLGDVCEFKYGKSLPATNRSGSGSPVFGSNGQVGSHDVALTSGPTIVIGRKGSFGEVHYSPARCWPIDTTYFIDEQVTDCDLRWLYYRLRGLGLTDLNRAAAVPGLNRDDAYRQPLLLPPIEEQRRLAAVLDHADALRTKRREALAVLNTLAESIFVDTLTVDATPERRPLGEIAAVQGGLQVTRARAGNPVEAPYLRVANVYRGYLDLSEIKTLEVTNKELERTRLHVDDLLIVEGHGNPAEIGRAARWDGSVDNCVHQNHLIRVRVDPSAAEPCYVEAFVNSNRGRQSLLRSANTTSGLNTISTGDVKAVIVDLPSRALQAQFARGVGAIAAERRRLERSAERLDELFASLQHRAFRGEL